MNDGRVRLFRQNGGLEISLLSFLQQKWTSGLAKPLKALSSDQILCFLKPSSLVQQGNYKKSLTRATLGENLRTTVSFKCLDIMVYIMLIKFVKLKHTFLYSVLILNGDYLDIKLIHTIV